MYALEKSATGQTYQLLFCITCSEERNTVERVCVCVCVCVCVLDREVSRVVASRALVVTQMAVHLTGYQNCLTGFCEPLSPPYIYRCHTSVKNV